MASCFGIPFMCAYLRRTPHVVSRLVQTVSVWSVKARRAFSTAIVGMRWYTAMNDNEYTPPLPSVGMHAKLTPTPSPCRITKRCILRAVLSSFHSHAKKAAASSSRRRPRRIVPATVTPTDAKGMDHSLPLPNNCLLVPVLPRKLTT